MTRTYLMAALGILALFALAMLWASGQRYYPRVEVQFPDRSQLVFVDMPWSSEKKCGEANARVSASVGGNCSLCKIVASCAGQIPADLKRALAGEAIGDYVVHSDTLRVVVRAGDASKQTCIAMAEQISRDKKQSALCVDPE